MPNDEYVRWQAYLRWRDVMREHAHKVAAARAKLR